MPSKPPWQPDGSASHCNGCKVAFSFDVRRHHCRHCGKIFCYNCSTKYRPLVCFGFSEPVRVCDACEKLCCVRDVFMEIVRKGDLDSARAVLEGQGLSPDSTTTLQTPILVAASRSHVEILKLLLSKGANVHGLHPDDAPTTGRKMRSDTPLHYASIVGSADAVSLLLANSADPNWQSTRFGETALHKAVVYGHTDIVHMLLEAGADSSLCNDRGLSPLKLAGLCGRDVLSEQFIRRGLEVDDSTHTIWDVLLALHLYKRPKEARRSFCSHLLNLHSAAPLQVELYLPFLCDLALHESQDDHSLQRSLLELCRASPPFGMELSQYVSAASSAAPAVAARLLSAIEDVLLSGELLGEAANIDSSPDSSSSVMFPTSVDGTPSPAPPQLPPHKAPIRAGIAAAQAAAAEEASRSKQNGVLSVSEGGVGAVCSLGEEQVVKERKAFLFRSRKFLRLCAEIGTKLPLVPPQFRDRELRVAVAHMNKRLPPGLYLPIFREKLPQFTILRVPPEESFAFHTKTRAPYLLIAEVQVLDLDSMPLTDTVVPGSPSDGESSMAGNTTMLRAIFGEPWSEKRERVHRNSPHVGTPAWALISFIVKSGDDLRQEQFAMHLIHLFQDIFQQSETSLWLRPYRVLVCSEDAGFIEAVPDCISLETLRLRTPGFTTLHAYFTLCYGEEGTPTFLEAQRKFVESMAAYAVVCFLLQVKDRHDGNVLLDREGHIIHIDYGFMFTNSPGQINFERAPFKLTQELVEVMGGRHSVVFMHFRELCVQGFLHARRSQSKILLLVEMMASGLGRELGLPCFSKGPAETVSLLRRNFLPGQSEEECVSYVHSLIDQSFDNWTTRQYDNYQRISKGVSYIFGW